MTTTTRGTTNRNARGSSYDREARRRYLVTTFRANVDLKYSVRHMDVPAPLGTGTPACRCYRCGKLLTEKTVTVDRIIPGCKGGTYRRDNIRPACGQCNSEVGGAIRGDQ